MSEVTVVVIILHTSLRRANSLFSIYTRQDVERSVLHYGSMMFSYVHGLWEISAKVCQNLSGC